MPPSNSSQLVEPTRREARRLARLLEPTAEVVRHDTNRSLGYKKCQARAAASAAKLFSVSSLLERLEWLIENCAGGNPTKLSTMCKMSRTHVSAMKTRLEQAERDGKEAGIELKTAKKLAHGTGCRIEWLVDGSGEPMESSKQADAPMLPTNLRKLVLQRPERWPANVLQAAAMARRPAVDLSELDWYEFLEAFVALVRRFDRPLVMPKAPKSKPKNGMRQQS